MADGSGAWAIVPFSLAASGVSDPAKDCSTASAAAFRAALASALSFSRQQCLYLRPEPQWQGSLRPGRAIVVAVIVCAFPPPDPRAPFPYVVVRLTLDAR